MPSTLARLTPLARREVNPWGGGGKGVSKGEGQGGGGGQKCELARVGALIHRGFHWVLTRGSTYLADIMHPPDSPPGQQGKEAPSTSLVVAALSSPAT